MALDFNSIENAAYYMKHSLEKQGYKIEATSAPSVTYPSLDDYRKFVSLTQRILDSSDKLLGYITYRVTQTTSVKHPMFSSYEVFDSAYASLQKYHLKDYSSADICFKTVYDYILNHFKMV